MKVQVLKHVSDIIELNSTIRVDCMKFNKSKLQRAEKRKAISQDSTIANVGKKFTRRSKQQLPIYEPPLSFLQQKS